MSYAKRNLIAALAAMAMFPKRSVLAGPQDYRFEPAARPMKSGDATVIRLRLVHLPEGGLVPGAIIIQPKLEMGEGQSFMAAPVKVGTANEAGLYTFEAKPGMAGEWALSFGAKVPGEPATIRTRIVLDLDQ